MIHDSWTRSDCMIPVTMIYLPFIGVILFVKISVMILTKKMIMGLKIPLAPRFSVSFKSFNWTKLSVFNLSGRFLVSLYKRYSRKLVFALPFYGWWWSLRFWATYGELISLKSSFYSYYFSPNQAKINSSTTVLILKS